MNAYEIKTNKSDYLFLVVASEMTDAIELYCRLTENMESTIESIRVLPYVPYQVFIPTMTENHECIRVPTPSNL